MQVPEFVPPSLPSTLGPGVLLPSYRYPTPGLLPPVYYPPPVYPPLNYPPPAFPPPIRGRGGAPRRSVPRGSPFRAGPPHSGSRSGNSPPSAAFGQTLQFITSIKLQELEKQRLAYEAHSTVLAEAQAVVDDLPLKVEILLKAIRSWSGSGAVDGYSKSSVIGGKLDLYNLDLWLLQARKDPSFSSDILKSWVDILEAHILHSLRRFDFAKLFGNLFTEWLSSGDSVTATPVADGSESPHAGSDEEFIAIGRKEMHDQKERLKSIIFEPKHTDTDHLLAYLSDLFSDETSANVLQSARTNIDQFCDTLQHQTITADDIRWTIDSLLASDLMVEDKRTTLREFCENPTVLEEVASVLNMRLGSLGSWSWPADGVVVDMRRHLNGKYRAFTDPDILDALFLQYLGVMWQVKFKEVFLDIFSSKAWKQGFPPLHKRELDRRQHHLGEMPTPPSIESYKQQLRRNHFLAGQLSSDVGVTPSYDDDDDDNSSDNEPTNVPAGAVKQKLLHIMTTDCYLNTALHGTHTAVRTDLEWFGPSLPHDSILALLSFFNVSQQWLDFYKVFLRAPMRFKEEPEEEPRIRERGTPISYALSVVCGEIILFAMDFAVNQRADGLFLYRIHDDLWFWDAQPEKCVVAWEEMNRYASLVGLKFNESKTGSACVGGTINPKLPPGDIRWGFLKFDAPQSRFVIDQRDVDTHIQEFRRQLSSTKSIFGWVNAYNKYMAFFVRNFGGRPAVCFGRSHVDEMIDTLGRIQRELFPNTKGGAVGHLRSVIGARFGIHDLPEGYFYFPVLRGGLEVRNPMIELLAIRNFVSSEPEEAFTSQMEQDVQQYKSLKERWESNPSPNYDARFGDEFLTFEEYISGRETRLVTWQTGYSNLMNVPHPVGVMYSPSVGAALGGVNIGTSDYYDKWIVLLYGEEMMKNFGSLEVVDPTLIPVGMVQLFRTSRMKWEQ